MPSKPSTATPIIGHSQPALHRTALADPWRIASVLVVTVCGALALWSLRDVLMVCFGAVLIATLLRSLSAPVQRYLQLSERLALATVVVLLCGVAAMVGWLIGDVMAEQIVKLREALPRALEAAQRWLDSHPAGLALSSFASDAGRNGVEWSRVASMATGTIGAIGAAALIVIIGVYLATDPRGYCAGVLRWTPLEGRPRVEAAMHAAASDLRRWLIGQGISMAAIGSLTALGLWLLELPFALTLGVIAGLLAFIPFFGSLASGILVVLLAFTISPMQALYATALCIFIQQIEGLLLQPVIQRWAVALPPALGLVAVLIFGTLFGLAGALFATPLMICALSLAHAWAPARPALASDRADAAGDRKHDARDVA